MQNNFRKFSPSGVGGDKKKREKEKKVKWWVPPPEQFKINIDGGACARLCRKCEWSSMEYGEVLLNILGPDRGCCHHLRLIP